MREKSQKAIASFDLVVTGLGGCQNCQGWNRKNDDPSFIDLTDTPFVFPADFHFVRHGWVPRIHDLNFNSNRNHAQYKCTKAIRNRLITEAVNAVNVHYFQAQATAGLRYPATQN